MVEMGMRYLVKKSTICGLQKYRSSSPSSIKGQNYGSLSRSWLQYHLLKIVRDRLHFINYRRIKNKQAVSCKDQMKGPTTESLEQFRVYDDFKSDDYERKVCSYNSYSQSKLCVVFRLSFSLKRLQFLTACCQLHSTICRLQLQINEQFTQPKTRNPKHTIKNGEEARLKLQTAARLA